MWRQWTRCWTNFDPKWTDYLYIQTGTETPEAATALLRQNYPNPFNPTTSISFNVPAYGHVTLTVYNVKGERVATLINEVMDAGAYTTSFSATNLASGTYFYTLKGDGFKETKKMVLLR
jgi:hypothetical protein